MVNKTRRKKCCKHGCESQRPLVFKEDDREEYAQVTKLLGDGRMQAKCFDGVCRLCRIRGNMRKKIWISNGDIVLVNLRPYEGSSKADVIFKYTPAEVRTLKTRGMIPESASTSSPCSTRKVHRRRRKRIMQWTRYNHLSTTNQVRTTIAVKSTLALYRRGIKGHSARCRLLLSVSLTVRRFVHPARLRSRSTTELAPTSEVQVEEKVPQPALYFYKGRPIISKRGEELDAKQLRTSPFESYRHRPHHVFYSTIF